MLTAILINGTSAASNITGGAFDLGDCTACSVNGVFSGGGGDLAGTLKLQGSNTTTSADFVDLSISQAITSSAPALLNVPNNAGYRYVRPVWTATSGTGNLTATIVVKQAVDK